MTEPVTTFDYNDNFRVENHYIKNIHLKGCFHMMTTLFLT